MDKQYTNKDIIYKIGYYRNKNKLSARELSLRLGKNEAFINRVERGKVELKTEDFIEILNLFELTPMEFFYASPEKYEKDREVLKEFNRLGEDEKNLVIELIKKIK